MYELAHAEKALKNLNSPNFALYGIPTSEAEFYEMYKPVVGTEADGTNILATAPSQYVISYPLFAAEIARLQAEYEATEYQRKRAAAYPSIADKLDSIYHGGIDAWKAEIAAVKTEYPKP